MKCCCTSLLEPVCVDFTVWSAYNTMSRTELSEVRWTRREEETRQHLCHVSGRSKEKGQECKTANKWLTDASMGMDAKPYSLGTRHKETDNPVLIFWIRKVNQHPHSIQTDSASKIYPVGYHSLSSFNSLLKPIDYSSHSKSWLQKWEEVVLLKFKCILDFWKRMTLSNPKLSSDKSVCVYECQNAYMISNIYFTDFYKAWSSKQTKTNRPVSLSEIIIKSSNLFKAAMLWRQTDRDQTVTFFLLSFYNNELVRGVFQREVQRLRGQKLRNGEKKWGNREGVN